MVGISGSYQVNGEKTRSAMPGSPVDVKVQSRATPPTMPPPPPSGNQGNSRPNSFTPTSLPNGVDHSPPALNGVPSPPQRFSNGPSSSLASQQLPATCGARQLSKLKRFLTTLQQFGNDISPEIGERVRSLVLALVANLPLLQRELLHCARSAKQTPAQYLAQHEHLLLNANATSPVNSTDLLEVNENGKRNSPERNKENGFDRDPPAKRVCTISPAQRHSPNIGIPHPANGQLHPTPPPLQHYSLDDVAINHLYRDPQRLPEYRDRHRHHGGSRAVYQEEMIDHRLTDREWAEEWKHLDHLLNCIMDMVEKTRRSLAVLCRCQEADREELNYWMRRYNDTEDVRKGGSTHLRQLSPGNTDTIQTELNREIGHRPSAGYVPDEIWKKAEEAVNEVKRQAVSQLQKAVTEAEQKAYEMITAERAKMEQKIADAKRQAAEDAFTVINEQEDTSESCWNCGRKASETCSGCNAARYCGSFCQHKDWEKHHRICGQNLHAQAKVVPAGGSGPKAAKGEKSPALEKAPPSTVTSRSATPAAPDASVQ
ncbi:protein CBFA2T2-like isoform X4 [Chiloscyllium plagiosum]|uniref:protein CBFA2T2-like isoform X4 n=1 Tax=Chiloscyllium plagiosum TaxID=36176 RepID=UPI001CB862DD|nr:protein CBFA2T2-like isoform X4 [Chiloscyllium plagiosum]